jgi:hypothetical protein
MCQRFTMFLLQKTSDTRARRAAIDPMALTRSR